MICAIIGSTKIAEVHIHELVKNKVEQIYIISRFKKKRINLLNKIVSRYKDKNTNFKSSNINILKKKKFDLIDICSSNHVHDKHLKYISGQKTIILIEKPIISLLKYKKDYLNFLDDIYRENKKLIVIYPMTKLARSIDNLVNINDKIKNFSFNFKVGGKYFYKNIIIDLIPHALSFTNYFFKFSSNKKKFFIHSVKIKKNSCIAKFKYSGSNISFYFSEKINQRTILTININNLKIQRLTKNKIENFINYLKFKKNIKIIKNPITEFFNEFFKNKNNKLYYKKNKDLTYEIMKRSVGFIN
tara:strand:+ start:1067 stop:1969 length:903 start_codon:yes stop_codon:yes gene_type:complete